MQYLIHIGYPKAASSLLQSTLFSGQDDNIKPLHIDGMPYIGYQKSGYQLFSNKRAENITYIDPFSFNPDEVRAKLEICQNKDANVICLSNELWAGHPFSGGVTAKEYADRFRKTLPDAKVLIVVRNQVDMIFSSYAHYIVKSKGGCTLDHFLSNNQHTQVPFHNLSYYCYDRLVKYYADIFGKDNLLVLPFEVLVQKGQSEFFQSIYNFLNLPSSVEFDSIEKNQSDYKKYTVLRSLPSLDRFSKDGPIHTYSSTKLFSFRKFLAPILSIYVPNGCIKRTIEKDKLTIRSYINDDILHSNNLLQDYMDIDLKSLGYLL